MLVKHIQYQLHLFLQRNDSAGDSPGEMNENSTTESATRQEIRLFLFIHLTNSIPYMTIEFGGVMNGVLLIMDRNLILTADFLNNLMILCIECRCSVSTISIQKIPTTQILPGTIKTATSHSDVFSPRIVSMGNEYQSAKIVSMSFLSMTRRKAMK